MPMPTSMPKQEPILISQFPLADHSKFEKIQELYRIIRDGESARLVQFQLDNPDITMTEDALGSCGRVSGVSGLQNADASPNAMIGVLETLYELGMINHHNEVIIYANLRVYRYRDWPVVMRLLEHLLNRDDAATVCVQYEDSDEVCDLARILSCNICTHFYGKPLPMVRRMYERLMNLGCQNVLDARQTFEPQYADRFLSERPEPNYSEWLKLGEEDENVNFLPTPTVDDW